MTAPHVPQGGEQLVAVRADEVGQGQQQVLDREVVVAHVGALGVGRGQYVPEGAIDARLLAAEGLG